MLPVPGLARHPPSPPTVALLWRRAVAAPSGTRTHGADCETLSSIQAWSGFAETIVYPGHGPATTLGDELAGNPFLVELRAVEP
jgi:glyoxylase-like metal-dependent hydrolase (beta-lactamase superfamily II)